MGPRITVSMIVKDEEEMIGRCLDSLKQVDEVVILDTGSMDNTARVVRKYKNVRYVAGEYQWNDSFAEARNESLRRCGLGWILVLDADEYLVTPVDEIREVLQKNQKARAIDIRCLDDATGRHEHRQPRLFRHEKDIYWKGAAHNYLSVLGEFVAPIYIKYGYSPAHQKDPDRTMRILQRAIGENNKLVREKFYLAREYWYRKDYLTAIEWYGEYFKVASWAPEIAEAWLMKSRCLFALNRGWEARDACFQAIKLNANFREAIQFMGDMCGPINRKRWHEWAKTATNEAVLFDRTV